MSRPLPPPHIPPPSERYRPDPWLIAATLAYVIGWPAFLIFLIYLATHHA